MVVGSATSAAFTLPVITLSSTTRPAFAAARSVPPCSSVEVHAAAAAETLTRRLQTRVEIERRGKGGVLRIHYHSEEELMRLYEVLMEKGEQR